MISTTLRDVYEAIQQLPQPQFLYISVAALALLLLLMLLMRRQPKHVVAYTTENGRVMVSRHAIVELVRTSCEQLQDVSKPQVKIRVKGQTSHFEIRIKLQGTGRLRQIEQTLQAHLRQALTENLGIESLGRINVIAVSFKSGRIESNLPAKSTTAALEATEAVCDTDSSAHTKDSADSTSSPENAPKA
ncbi:alkaline shock response membrane anchor protein AmaP [Coraliomargarita sp. SDUM461004]|uniref:Alkaline shock response membrane anchor protein AmaP n=1 Tax=Thalassobacterium sedimentorum TaxID=3041258 RepID=A0ABU1AIH0_9BACT|nr:alkaline shock response membrane anchor protein AmaP [Coraliomargarita sp. SDUM461004]MDQ8193581.1 alkaline shock response membrane anchor protein AmaP [Coraliomargarita sp. SDUM461004]